MKAGAEYLPDADIVLAVEAEECEKSLAVFMRQGWHHVDPDAYVHGPHIDLMAEYLEEAMRGGIPNLLINIPPGHQKSLSVSVFLQPWVWTTRPHRRFACTSYRGDLALRDADRSRALIRSEWYQAHWGRSFSIRGGQDVKSRYANDKGGYRFSTATAGIMGEGGDVVVHDDPHSVDQAESDEVREETVRRLRLAMPTRVRSADGCQIVMMQRLHERDYSGHLLAERTGLVHLCLPARFESDHPFICLPTKAPRSGRPLRGDWRTRDGELLWPGRYTEERMSALETAVGTYGAAGQFQQRPAPRDGGMFKREWFGVVDAAPKGRRICRGWDLAGTEESSDSQAAYTAGVRISEVDGYYYIEDVRRERLSPAGVERMMLNTAKQDGRSVIIDFPQDPGQAGKSQAQHLVRMLVGYVAKFSPESGSKITRAEAFAAQAEAGNVKLVKGDWNEAYLDEMCAFPNSKYKDQADASSRAFHRLHANLKRAGAW